MISGLFGARRSTQREPMSDDEFEQMIEAHVIRGWRVQSRTTNTAVMVFEDVDRAAIMHGGRRSILHGTPMKRNYLTLTRFQRRDIWLTRKERQLLGEVE
jgi:hypothetical protein